MMKTFLCLLLALSLLLGGVALAENATAAPLAALTPSPTLQMEPAPARPQQPTPEPAATEMATPVPSPTQTPYPTPTPRAAATATPEVTAVPETTATPEAAAPETSATPEAAGETSPAPEGIFDRLPADMPTVPPLPTREPGRLTGVKIGIDPGHQAQGNSDQEAVAPGSSETKAKVSSGTYGRFTGVPEYEVNLAVSLKLREALEALGCEVYMTRETNDVDISNQERAIMMNELGVDLVLRIHCNGSTNESAQGIGLYIRATGTNADECMRAAEALLPAMVEATGAESDGIFRRDTYTGLNWSEVPSILVEMGFMTNEEEDYKLNDPAYQDQLVAGMVEGVCAYMGR